MPVGRELGRGARSVVYEWGEHDAVKLAEPSTPTRWISDELRLALAAERAGAPTAGGWRLVETGGMTGLVSRRIDGPSMLELLFREPGRVTELAGELARLQLDVFACRPSYELPSQWDRLRAKMRTAARRHDERLSTVLDLTPRPRLLALCHGDLHPGNILLDDDGSWVLIDWFDTGRGDPAADIARTLVLLADTSALPGPLPDGVDAQVAAFRSAYLDAITGLSAITAEEIGGWVLPHRVARLAEGFGLAGIDRLVAEIVAGA